MRTLAPAILVSACLLHTAANAMALTWNLQGVGFDDGGTASGSLLYDPDTNTYSSVAIRTTPGSVVLGGATYNVVLPSPAPSIFSVKLVTTNAANLTGTRFLLLSFVPAVSDAGTVNLFLTYSAEGICANAPCTSNAAPLRHVTSGTVGSSIPLLDFFFESGAAPGAAVTCAAPTQTCSGSGCVNLNSDLANCGGCGQACASGNNFAASCNGGICSGSCNPGFADCNLNLQSDGCEVNLQTNVNNCGACGLACPAGNSCISGTCTPPACFQNGAACTMSSTCCSGICNNGQCAATACTPNGGPCDLNNPGACCAQICFNNPGGATCGVANP